MSKKQEKFLGVREFRKFATSVNKKLKDHDKQHKSHNKRFNGIDKRLDGIDMRLDKLEKSHQIVANEVANLSIEVKKLSSLPNQFKEMLQILNEIRRELSRTSSDKDFLVKENKDQNSTLDIHGNKIENHEVRITTIETNP